MFQKNILETIGQTPLVKINRLNPNPRVTLLAKLEGANPGGSVKDRIALEMIEQAERDGSLTKDKIIIEPTSGNTGIGLAMVGVVKGYQVVIVMSESVSIERRKTLAAFGAKLILTDPTLGTDGAIMKAREMVKESPDKYFMPDQFSNKNNILAHYKTTAREIWEQTGGQIDFLVASIGTSGTLMGLSRFLKEKNPKIKIVCAHPVKGHAIQGLKNLEEAIVPAIYDPRLIDQTITVENQAAFETVRQVVKQEGIFIGMSSGAAMYAARELAKTVSAGVMVVIFPDRGEKYLSTNLFDKTETGEFE